MAQKSDSHPLAKVTVTLILRMSHLHLRQVQVLRAHFAKQSPVARRLLRCLRFAFAQREAPRNDMIMLSLQRTIFHAMRS